MTANGDVFKLHWILRFFLYESIILVYHEPTYTGHNKMEKRRKKKSSYGTVEGLNLPQHHTSRYMSRPVPQMQRANEMMHV